jgi:hypothetical protein
MICITQWYYFQYFCFLVVAPKLNLVALLCVVGPIQCDSSVCLFYFFVILSLYLTSGYDAIP